MNNQKKASNTETIYGKIWENLKHFPKGLSEGSPNPPVVSGPASAALISAAIGCFTMMVTHHLADTSKEREEFIWDLGSWIPGSHNPDPQWGNIGCYSGEETMLLLGWLVSWLILHFCWRNKNIQTKNIFFWMFTLLIAATAMTWHPLFPYLPLM